MNLVRAEAGLRAVQSNPVLNAATSAYARLLAERGHFSHTGPDGSTPEQRLKAAGYSGAFLGEALAAGQASAQAVVSSWLASPAHRDILMTAAATSIGIGHYYQAGSNYGHYWVLVVGSP